MSLEETSGQRRRRRADANQETGSIETGALESGATDDATQADGLALLGDGAASDGGAGDGGAGDGGAGDGAAAPTRRQIREQREREERERAAAEATQVSVQVVPDVLAPSSAPQPEDDAATPPGAVDAPRRRSMRDLRPDAPAGGGRGERMPAPKPDVETPEVEAPAAAPVVTPTPAPPTVRTPAAAQGVRGVTATGELSQVRSTRASDDSPVEVTGPIDWSSAVLPTASTDEPAVIPPRQGAAEESEAASEQPARKSVLGRRKPAPAAPAVTPTWAPVLGDGAGAAVPTPSQAPPPSPTGVFARLDEAEEELPEAVDAEAPAAFVPAERAATEVADGVDDAPERRRGWLGPLGYVLLAALGVAIGVGIYYLILN